MRDIYRILKVADKNKYLNRQIKCRMKEFFIKTENFLSIAHVVRCKLLDSKEFEGKIIDSETLKLKLSWNADRCQWDAVYYD